MKNIPSENFHRCVQVHGLLKFPSNFRIIWRSEVLVETLGEEEILIGSFELHFQALPISLFKKKIRSSYRE